MPHNRESYLKPTPVSKPNRPKKPKQLTPIIQLTSSYTKATFLLDYDDDEFNQWLAEKWLDWTIDDYHIPSGDFVGEVTSKEFAFIMGAWTWINNNIDYNLDALDTRWSRRKASDVLNRGYGVCSDFSVLFVAILRSAGIKARLVEGKKRESVDYHEWTQVKIGDVWYDIDPLIDSNPDFVLDEYKAIFINYIPAILGSNSDTSDPYYSDDVKQFFETNL